MDNKLCIACLTDFIYKHGTSNLGDEKESLEDPNTKIYLCEDHTNRTIWNELSLAKNLLNIKNLIKVK